MVVFIKLAFRNLIRHKRRNIITGSMLAIATLMMVLTIAYGKSVEQSMTDSIIRTCTGNIQIHADYHGKIDVLNPSGEIPYFGSANEIQRIIKKENGIIEAAPRIRIMGLLLKGDESNYVSIVGIDPLLEPKVTPKLKIIEGSYLTGEHGILLGRKAARQIQAKIGDEMVLVVSNGDGVLNGFNFKVQGIVSAEGAGLFLDRKVYIDINTAKELLYLNPGEGFEFAVTIDKGSNEKSIIAAVKSDLSKAGYKLRVDPWNKVAELLTGIITLNKFIPQLALAILLLVVIIGVCNTVLMSILERTKEIGTMMAIGMKKKEVIILYLLETGILSMVSSCLGLLIGAGIILWLGNVGIPASIDALEFAFGGKRLFIIFDGMGMLISFFGVVLLSLIAALFPTRLVIRLKPIEALRQNH